MKRQIKIIFFIIINLYSTSVSASEQINIYTVKGSSLSIPVYLNEIDDCRGVALTTTFNHNVLQPVGGFLTGTTLENLYKIESGLLNKGKFSIGVYPYNNRSPVSGVMCFLQFQATGYSGVSSTLQFSKFESNNNTVTIPDNGGFWINGKSWKTMNIVCKKIDLSCVIVVLQMITGITKNNLLIDMNHDQRTGIEDVLYILKDLSISN